jgi:hypothetical protein
MAFRDDIYARTTAESDLRDRTNKVTASPGKHLETGQRQVTRRAQSAAGYAPGA